MYRCAIVLVSSEELQLAKAAIDGPAAATVDDWTIILKASRRDIGLLISFDFFEVKLILHQSM